MKEWFTQFENSLKGEKLTLNLEGAGHTSGERAMAHYRYQHLAKIRSCVESTFVVLKAQLGEEWDEVWSAFTATHFPSLRSMDWMSEIFLKFYLSTDATLAMKELARFEHLLDIHPWTHRKPEKITLEGMDGESSLILGHLDLHLFQAPVIELYRQQAPKNLETEETILLWMMNDGVHFRRMEEWEVKVLKTLSLSVNDALEHAPEDETAVAEFFCWLGESGLIRQVNNPATFS